MEVLEVDQVDQRDQNHLVEEGEGEHQPLVEEEEGEHQLLVVLVEEGEENQMGHQVSLGEDYFVLSLHLSLGLLDHWSPVMIK